MSMSVRPYRRACVVAAAALVTALSFPPAAQASNADDSAPPALESTTSAEAQGPRLVPGPSSAPTGGSSRSGVAPLAATAPAAVATPSLVGLASTRAELEWTAPSDGGSPITGYHLQLLQGGVVLEELVTDAPITSVSIFDLLPDTTYEFRVAAVNSVGTGEFSTPVPFTTTHWSVDRVFGQDRFQTAVRVSEDAFPYAGVQLALVANGLNFPDALASAAAGGAFGGPVLLTAPTAVSNAVVEELHALQPDWVFVSGGTASVSNSVLATVSGAATAGSDRLAGQSRYGTAAVVSTLWEPNDTVFLASGMNYPDALAGAAAAGYEGAPVLLTARDSLPAETAEALAYHAPTRIVVLGGTGSVSTTAANQAKAAAGTNPVVERLSGVDRYQTAIAISKDTFPESPRVPVVYVASGAGFADALSGAAAAGNLGGPMLLTPYGSAPAAVLAEIDRLDPVRVVVLGGPGAVSDTVVAQIEAALG